MGVEVVLRDGEDSTQLEHQELQDGTLATGQRLFSRAVVAEDNDPDITPVGIALGMGALVGNGPSLPDPSFAVDDVVVADVGPALVTLVVTLDAEDLSASCPSRGGIDSIRLS